MIVTSFEGRVTRGMAAMAVVFFANWVTVMIINFYSWNYRLSVDFTINGRALGLLKIQIGCLLRPAKEGDCTRREERQRGQRMAACQRDHDADVTVLSLLRRRNIVIPVVSWPTRPTLTTDSIMVSLILVFVPRLLPLSAHKRANDDTPLSRRSSYRDHHLVWRNGPYQAHIKLRALI
ncbi:hypothetical protein BCV69DRAFT_117106 [Microstroma glucosiphilum]|uniref:Uncharacterized protein n=1 Tax=Pseudomicrostroma glucosiphilum TaxID=1684307 RepID=A0A316UEN7_9BASI|nr:hypothetical protein BCV69DRAFT_117106 [Pseudomicrostroma glucosiphilum]PWN23364.1 hypothetical protein BCV69DRAFT_117106 [Pseudomicrostroma glucosiphilum]